MKVNLSLISHGLKRHLSHIFMVIFLNISLCGYSFAYLDPGSFSSLGTFNPSSNVIVNMSTRSMTGGVTATGVMSGDILVFTFDSFSLGASYSISFSNITDNDDKIAFLSKGDMTISGSIYANASGTAPGPGGRRGGTSKPEVGQGTGGGQVDLDGGNDDGAGGGGFGGAGGAHGYGAPGGTTYGNLTTALEGGSGGARSYYSSDASAGGGGGGGALELGALGTIILNSGCNIEAKGAAGSNSDLSGCGSDGDGGGSGGGILIHGNILTFNSGANVDASGGNGGNGDDGCPGGGGEGGSGGGGGGGRVRVAYNSSGTNNGNISVAGGSAGSDSDHPGNAGSAGVVQFVQDSNVPVTSSGPEISVYGNSVSINDGDSTPSITDDTHFGDVDKDSGTATHTFTIKNTGPATLTISGGPNYVSVDNAVFSVTSQPSDVSLEQDETTTFSIQFDPDCIGIETANVSFANNDDNENPFNFVIEGNGTSAASLYLDGRDFTSLGSFNPSSDVSVNMSTGVMTGGISATGTVSNGILVFTFDDFTLASSRNINFTNTENSTNKVAFLSLSNMTLSGAINASGSTYTPGPGGGAGGTARPSDGTGAGGGGSADGAGGAGFGGAGGNSGNGVGGGSTYGDLSVSLSGGSGGARSEYSSTGNYGGGGGGALQLGALGIITINSGASINANGVTGSTSTEASADGDGGGSGGGILIHGQTIQHNSGSTISANGGNGGGTSGAGLGIGGGGGGGGRVRLVYHTSGAGNIVQDGTITVNGGTGGTDATPGEAGTSGTSSWASDINVPIGGPEISIEGNSTVISDGDTSPSVDDDTDFGNVNVASGSNANTFKIENSGGETLNLTDSSPYVTITGHTSDFTLTSNPSNSILAGSSTTFEITFDPTAGGTRSATISIANDDSDENPYNFDVQGTGISLPVISNLNGDSLSYNEGDGAILLDQGTAASVSDADSSDFNGGNLTVTISAGEIATEDVLSLGGTVGLSGTTAGSNVSVGGTVIGTLANNIATGNDLVINFNGNATPSSVTSLIQAITYENTNTNNPTSGARTIDVTVNDGDGGISNTASVTVTVNNINDNPTITGLPTDITVTEETASNVDFSSATFSDVDSGAANVTMTLAAGSGTLSATSGGGVTIGGSGTSTLTLSGTVSNIDTFLNTASNIKYTGTTDITGNDADTITVTADDGGNTGSGGGGNISLGTVNVDITPVNDPPLVGGVFGDTSSQVVAGAGSQNVTGLDDATVINADSTNYDGGFLTITQSSGTTNGSWGVDGTTATSGGDATIAAGETIAVGGTSIGTVHAANDGQGGNSLRIDFNTANSTSANIQTLIRAITYSAPSSLGARTFTLALNDNDGTASGGDEDTSGNFVITVTPNPPVIANLNGDSVATLPNISVNVDAGGNATVTDADNPNFNGGNLTVTRTSGFSGNFSLSGSGATGVSSGSSPGTADGTIASSEIIYVDGVAIAAVSATSNGQVWNNLITNFGSNATPARVQSLIRALLYGSATVGAHTFSMTITDSGSNAATSSPSSFTVNVTAPEIDIKGNGTSIPDNDTSPDTSDDTDFGSTGLVSGGITHTFTIENTGSATLNLTDSSPYLVIAGTNSGDFSLGSIPSNTIASGGGTTTFDITFNPSAVGLREATISIANNDSDENPYNFSIQGTALPDVTISGTVTDGTNPIQGVTITFSHDGHTETTAADGTYSYTVSSGTTTTLTPSHPGYGSWNPASRELSNILADQPDQNFQATINTYTISGTVTDSVNPIEGVTITFSHNGHTETTAADGTYSYTVDYNTTTTITPTHPGYGSWNPADRTVNNISANQPGQDFHGTINTYTISGTVTDGVNPIQGATITFSHNGHTETTAADGAYSYTVDYNTTTTITPSHAGYVAWTPADRTVNNISADQPGQEFLSTSDSDAIPSQEESGPDANDPSYDGNADGVPDNNQPNVVSFHTEDGNNYVTLAAPDGTIFADVHALPSPAPGIFPELLSFPYGMFSFTLTGVTPGGAAQVVLFLSGEASIDSYWKYGREPGDETVHPYEFMLADGTGAEIIGNTIVLHFIDGEKGDDGLIAEGTIVDDGGPGVTANTIPALSNVGMIALIIMLFTLAWFMIRKRRLQKL
ncbi:MAG TPA: choice-of-anchor D domain-containing protein [Desulfobacteraceae bacterium]|nr:choice-of-anchor D domain-containing protein [Desulfobacteraceae bacterium]